MLDMNDMKNWGISLTIDELYEQLNQFLYFKIEITHSGFSICTDLLCGLVKESRGFSFDNFCEIWIKTVDDAFAIGNDIFVVGMDGITLEIYAFQEDDLD